MSGVQKHIARFFILLSVLAVAFWLAEKAGENEFIRQIISEYGYGDIFVVTLASGFNLAVPVPAVSFMPLFIEAGLNKWAVFAVIVFGVTVADSIAYAFGRTGRMLLALDPERRMTARLERLRARFRFAPHAALFLFASLVPLPNEILVVPLGFLGYRLRSLLPPLFLGNAAFNALSGFGIMRLFEVL